MTVPEATTPEELGREIRRLVALCVIVHPHLLDVPEDIVRRAAAERLLARRRRGARPLVP